LSIDSVWEDRGGFCSELTSSLMIKAVDLFAMPRQVAGLRGGLTAGGTGAGAVAGMVVLVFRQVAGL